MAGATNKSAKRLGYTKAQIQTERAKGGILSHAALLASGAPARPTKAHKALVEAMDARKQGLTRKAEPPAGWKAAARGEGAEGRAAAKSARDAFVAKRDAAVKRDALVARTAKNIGDVSRIARGMQQKQAADAQAKAAADAKQAQIGRTARALGDASKIARGMRQKQAADAAQKAAAPDPHAEKRARIAQLERKLELGKQINKVIRAEEKKGGDGWEERAAQRLLSDKILTNEGIARKVVQPDFAGRRGMPNYQFTNDGATIRRLKDEIGMDRKKGVAWDQRKSRHVPDFGPARPGVPIRLI